MSDFLSSLEKWENLIKQHDTMVGELDGVHERVKIATLISRMGKGSVGVATCTRYEDLWRDLVECLLVKKRFGGDSSGLLGGGRDHGGPTPMEIGVVNGQYGKKQHQQTKGRG